MHHTQSAQAASCCSTVDAAPSVEAEGRADLLGSPTSAGSGCCGGAAAASAPVA